MSLSCDSGIIDVLHVDLGETNCYWWLGFCCPDPSDCKRPASGGHTKNVHDNCNGRRHCLVKTAREYIECNGKSEYETITYHCVGKFITCSSNFITTLSLYKPAMC